jgi:putative membrane protein
MKNELAMKRISKSPLNIKKIKLLRFGRDFKPDQQVILRDYLAIERTRLANERTLLSYIRSSLYLLLGAIALYQLKEFANFQYLALTAIVFSVVFFIIGVYRFTLLKKSLKRVYYKSEEKEANDTEE